MKKQTAFFLLLIIPFLYLRAQNGDFVFDPHRLLPATTAQIDSTAAHVFNAGMTSRSNIGLFKESITYIGQLTMGKDSLIVSYCQSIDTLLTKVNTSALESALKRNLLFLKDNALYISEGNTWTYVCDTVRLIPFSFPPSYTLNSSEVTHRSTKDSIVFSHLNGIYKPSDGSLEVKKAIISYPVNDKDSITYRISSCVIPTTEGTFSCSTSTASFPLYKIKELSGHFTYTPSSVTSPLFTSNETSVVISDSANSWNAVGRFTMKGKDTWMEKDDMHHSRLLLLRSDSIIAKILSEKILITDTTVRIPSASVAIYIKNDSITHPMLLAQYQRAERTLTLFRTTDPLSSAPYFDSFSALKLFARAMRLECKTGDIAFAFDPRTRPLVISDRYFEKEIYKYFQGTALTNPLPVILSICGTYGATTVDFLAQKMGIPTSTVVQLAMDIARLGYGYYDYTGRALSLYPRFEHMVLSARGKSDFDGISYYGKGEKDIISHLSGNTGYIDLSGMEMVKLSPSGDIFLTPDSTGVKAEKGGDFSYGGEVTLGLFTIKGKAAFKYAENKIEMSGASKMTFRIPVKDTFMVVKNAIDSLRGSIILNTAENKAQRGQSKRYPLLTTTSMSYIFYPRLDSIYSHSELFVTIEPFTLDSLTSRNTNGIHFDGTVHTGAIVPPFARTVSVQKDLTLGFEKADFSSGVPFYGKGTYYGTVSLGEKGLTGAGKYEYLSATIQTDSISLRPKIAYSTARVSVEESTTYDIPEMFFTSARTFFHAADDSLYIVTDTIAANIFSGKMKFLGTISLSAHRNKGEGILSTDISTMKSDTIFFHREEITSPRMDITFGTTVFPTKVEIKNAKARVNPSARSGLFTMNDPFSVTLLPQDSACLHLNTAQWDMDAGTVSFSEGKNGGKISLFYPSVSPLTFYAGEVLYNINTDSLAIHRTHNLHVGDALIIPQDSSLYVSAGGKISILEGSEIYLDTITGRHHLYNAHLNIFSGKKLEGNATYDYTDADGVQYPMFFSSITVDEKGEVVAAADTYMNEDYPLGAYFMFRGQSTLRGSSDGLGLRGTLRPVTIPCTDMTIGSMKIDAPVSTAMIFQPFSSSYINGIVWDKGSFQGAFLVSDSTGMNVFSSVNGALRHDDFSGTFIVGDTAKNAYSRFIYYSDECRMDVQGDIVINDPSAFLISRGGGESSLDLNSSSVKVKDFSLSIKADFPKEVNDALASFVSGLGKINKEEKTSPSLAYISDFLEKTPCTLVVSGVQMKSGEDKNNLTSSGDITVNTVCGVPIYAVVSGKMCITKNQTGGDELTFYLKGENSDDFFFLRYKNGAMDFLCSDKEIMNVFDTSTEKYKNAPSNAYVLRRATKARVVSFTQ